VFRLPGSGERVQRRFLRGETVEVLYRYIDSIIDKIQFESGNTHPAYTIL